MADDIFQSFGVYWLVYIGILLTQNLSGYNIVGVEVSNP